MVLNKRFTGKEVFSVCLKASLIIFWHLPSDSWIQYRKASRSNSSYSLKALNLEFKKKNTQRSFSMCRVPESVPLCAGETFGSDRRRCLWEPALRRRHNRPPQTHIQAQTSSLTPSCSLAHCPRIDWPFSACDGDVRRGVAWCGNPVDEWVFGMPVSIVFVLL